MIAKFRKRIESSDSSHAVLETKSRIRKANKILSVLAQYKDVSKSNMLDIGTGSGRIAYELSKKVKNVTSADLVDERKVKEGYDFKLVKDESLPFENESFDIVISNHVAEHMPNQEKHFSEIYRVLKSGGIIYLATPNKFWITDPHYKLPLISWLPRRISLGYLRLLQKADWDIYPISHLVVRKYFAQAEVKNALPLLIRGVVIEENGNFGKAVKALSLLPRKFDDLSKYYSPTLIYILKKK